MDKHFETIQTWNKLANIYQDKFMHLDLYNESYDHFCDYFQGKKSRILDIGCGPGNISKYLLSRNDQFEILGIDMAPNMIALAKLNNPNANFKVMDCNHIDEIKDQFDGIICGFCIPYLSSVECDLFLLNAYNLLNNEGIIYLSFVPGQPDQSEFKQSNMGKVYFYYHQRERINKLLIELGFDIKVMCDIDFYRSENNVEQHVCVIARKSKS